MWRSLLRVGGVSQATNKRWGVGEREIMGLAVCPGREAGRNQERGDLSLLHHQSIVWFVREIV